MNKEILFYVTVAIFIMYIAYFANYVKKLNAAVKYAYYMQNECNGHALEMETQRSIMNGSIYDLKILRKAVFRTSVVIICILGAAFYGIIGYELIEQYNSSKITYSNTMISVLNVFSYKFYVCALMILFTTAILFVTYSDQMYSGNKDYKIALNNTVQLFTGTVFPYGLINTPADLEGYNSATGEAMTSPHLAAEMTAAADAVRENAVTIGIAGGDGTDAEITAASDQMRTNMAADAAATVQSEQGPDMTIPYLKILIDRITQVNNMTSTLEGIMYYNTQLLNNNQLELLKYVDFKNDMPMIQNILGISELISNDTLYRMSDYNSFNPLYDSHVDTYYTGRGSILIDSKLEVGLLNLQFLALFIFATIFYMIFHGFAKIYTLATLAVASLILMFGLLLLQLIWRR